MIDEELIKKYRYLKENLETIKSNLIESNEEYNNLNNAIKETIMIDDEIISQEDMIMSINTINNIVNDINYILIPTINRKI